MLTNQFPKIVFCYMDYLQDGGCLLMSHKCSNNKRVYTSNKQMCLKKQKKNNKVNSFNFISYGPEICLGLLTATIYIVAMERVD